MLDSLSCPVPRPPLVTKYTRPSSPEPITAPCTLAASFGCESKLKSESSQPSPSSTAPISHSPRSWRSSQTLQPLLRRASSMNSTPDPSVLASWKVATGDASLMHSSARRSDNSHHLQRTRISASKKNGDSCLISPLNDPRSCPITLPGLACESKPRHGGLQRCPLREDRHLSREVEHHSFSRLGFNWPDQPIAPDKTIYRMAH